MLPITKACVWVVDCAFKPIAPNLMKLRLRRLMVHAEYPRPRLKSLRRPHRCPTQRHCHLAEGLPHPAAGQAQWAGSISVPVLRWPFSPSLASNCTSASTSGLPVTSSLSP